MPIDERHLRSMVGAESPARVPPICPQCGYNLTGLTSNRCPECGHIFVRSEVARLSQDLSAVLARHGNWRARVRAGFWTALAAGGLLALGKLAGPSFETPARVVTIVAGFIAASLGLNVLLIYRYPAWVREQITPRPDPMIGVGVGALGLVDVVLALLLP